MKNYMKYSIYLACFLLVSTANAAPIRLKKGNLNPADLLDISWTSQSGNCPTKFPVKSINCSYSSSTMQGVKAQFINKIGKAFTTTNTYTLNINLNPTTQKLKHYAFDVASCTNLQSRMGSKSIIIINKTGCVIS